MRPEKNPHNTDQNHVSMITDTVQYTLSRQRLTF